MQDEETGTELIEINEDPPPPAPPGKAENDRTNELIQAASCKAPIASLDCMEDFAASIDGPNSNHAPISRQTSLNVNLGIHYKNLGKSGLRVSNLALATWITFGSQVSDEVAEDIVALAYDSGINVFDTAEAFTAGRYITISHTGMGGSGGVDAPTEIKEDVQPSQYAPTPVAAEVLLGKILKKKGWRRSSYVVMTKLYWGGNKSETERGLSRKHIIEGIQSSLERLQLCYVDVVFANKVDPLCPMEEIVRAFTYCINQGMAMYWGTSRWSPMEIMEAYTVARQFNLIPPICEQMEYHMFCREKAEIYLPEMYHKIGVGAMTWSPLVCGVSNNKFDEGLPPVSRSSIKGYTWLKDKLQSEDMKKQQAKIREVSMVAEKLGCSFSQLTVAWCLRNDNVHCVMVGATSVEQIYEHIQALQIRPKLNSALMAQLEIILDNKPVRPPLKR